MRNNRPLLVAVLVAANVAALALNAYLYRDTCERHGRDPVRFPAEVVDLARRIDLDSYHVIVFDEPIPTVYLKDAKGVRR